MVKAASVGTTAVLEQDIAPKAMTMKTSVDIATIGNMVWDDILTFSSSAEFRELSLHCNGLLLRKKTLHLPSFSKYRVETLASGQALP